MRSIRLHLTIAGHPAAVAYSTLAHAADGCPGLLGRPEAGLGLFDGSWSCVDDGDGAAVSFAARLGQCDPTGDDPHEPAVVWTLLDETVALVSGLFPGDVRVDDVVIQPHHSA